MKKNVLLIASICLIVSCAKNEKIEELSKNQDLQTNSFSLDIESARGLASQLELQNPYETQWINEQNDALRKTKTFNIISEEFVVSNLTSSNSRITESESPAYYLFNYSDSSGFSIISADFRAAPVLAYSDIGSLDLSRDTLDMGLLTFLEEYYDYLQSTKDSVQYFTKDLAEMWMNVGMDADALPEPVDLCEIEPDYPCWEDSFEPTTNTWGPHLQTEWNQNGVYNDAAPNLGCSGGDQRAVTGCVATAMAQVIRYWQHPSRYNYSAMPIGDVATTEIAQLIRDCGDAVDMNWGCNISTAGTSDARKALENDFGYSKDADYVTYNYTRMKGNITSSRPVILRACRNRRRILWWYTYSNCHAWVADGIKVTHNLTNSVYQIHMNWGWGGTHDGWFTTWTPSSSHYQYDRKMIVDIHP